MTESMAQIAQRVVAIVRLTVGQEDDVLRAGSGVGHERLGDVADRLAGGRLELHARVRAGRGGQGSPSYLAAMAAALFSAGATLSVSAPCSAGHIPPPVGLVPQIVVKPNRTWESSGLITDSIAVFSVYHELFFWSSQTGFDESRQWNMLPERSTSR